MYRLVTEIQAMSFLRMVLVSFALSGLTLVFHNYVLNPMYDRIVWEDHTGDQQYLCTPICGPQRE